jgi:hypothetical protein
MWGTVAVVLLVVVVVGFIYTGRNRGKLTPQQEQQWNQTIRQQYKGYFGPNGGPPIRR